MLNLILYNRNDLDMKMSLAITRFYMDYYRQEFKLVDLSGVSEFPWHEIYLDTRIFFLGMTPELSVFKRLEKESLGCIWITDKDYEPIYKAHTVEFPTKDIIGRRDNLAICQLTWDTYFGWASKRPEAINLVGAYSLWQQDTKDWDSKVLPFCIGLKAEDLDPLKDRVFLDLWKPLFCFRRDPSLEAEILTRITNKGSESGLLASGSVSYLEEHGFEETVGQHKVFSINILADNINVFLPLFEKYTIFKSFVLTKDLIKVKVYATDDTDLLLLFSEFSPIGTPKEITFNRPTPLL